MVDEAAQEHIPMSEDTTVTKNSKPHILFLSQYFWPEENTTSWLMSTLAFELAAQGFDVSAVAGQPAYRRAAKLPRTLSEKDVSIRRVYSTRFNKNNALGRILNSVTFTISIFLDLLRRKDVDLILLVTNPPILLWVVRLIQALRRITFIPVVHDVYPQVIVAVGRMRAGSLIYRLWHWLSCWSYRGATRIVVLGACMAKVIRSQLPPEQESKIEVIPNWDDENLLRPIPRDGHPTIRDFALEDKFIVQYAGNIGLFHEIKTVVKAAKKLHETNVQFVFIGDGGQAPWLAHAIRKRGLKNITMMPFRPKEQMPLILTACDVGLVTLRQKATGLCVPSKLYGIFAVGKAVVALVSHECEIADTVLRHNCGIVVEPGDAENLASEILRLKSKPDLLRRMGKNARKAFEEEFTLKAASKQYARLIREILASK